MTHYEAKQKLILAGRVLVAQGQDDFTRGHVSVRAPDDPWQFFMKPHSVGLDELTHDNILTIDLNGLYRRRRPAPQRGVHPLRNLQIAARRAERRSHPPALRGGALGDRPTDAVLQPAGGAVLPGARHLCRNHQPDSDARRWAPAVAHALGPAYAALLKNHGVVVVGGTIEEAVINTIMLENAAMIQMITEAAGDPAREFPADDIAQLKHDISRPDQFVVNFNYLVRRLRGGGSRASSEVESVRQQHREPRHEATMISAMISTTR